MSISTIAARAARDRDLSRYSLRLLFLLIGLTDAGRRGNTITVSSLGEKLGLSERSVYRALAQLRARKYIIVIEGDSHTMEPNTYYLDPCD